MCVSKNIQIKWKQENSTIFLFQKSYKIDLNPVKIMTFDDLLLVDRALKGICWCNVLVPKVLATAEEKKINQIVHTIWLQYVTEYLSLQTLC